jgi:hypothetical protein
VVSSTLSSPGNTHWWPKWIGATDPKTLMPGLVGTVVVGAFAAAVNWGLYGPFAEKTVFGDDPAAVKATIQLAALVTGGLVGFVGAKWLTNEAEKRLFKNLAVHLARSDARPDLGLAIALASPKEARQISI